MTHPLSIQAYREIQSDLPAKRKKVLLYVMHHPGETRKEIARGLGWPINSVTGRVTELINQRYLIEHGEKNKCSRLYATEPNQQTDLVTQVNQDGIIIRAAEKLKKKINGDSFLLNKVREVFA